MSGSKKHRHYSDQKTADKGGSFAKVPIVLLSMILSGLLLLLVSTYFILKTNSPLLLSAPSALASLYICSFIGGIICSLMLSKSKSYICALLSSSALVLFTLLLKAIIPRSPSSPQAGVLVTLHALIIVACLSGTFIAEKCKKQRVSRHTIRRK